MLFGYVSLFGHCVQSPGEKGSDTFVKIREDFANAMPHFLRVDARSAKRYPNATRSYAQWQRPPCDRFYF